MKKVIGVALAASLVAGMAFADVAVKLNNNVRTNMYHQVKDKDDNKSTYTFDLDGASGHAGTADGQKGVLGFSAKNDYAGVDLDISTDRSASLGYDGTYTGFMKFGGLNLTFGTFSSRHVNRYNVTAGEAGLLDSDDISKYGTALLNGFAKKTVTLSSGKTKDLTYNTGLLKDASDVATIAGTKSTALIADYTFDDVAGGKVLVKAGLLTSNYKTDEDTADNKKYQKAGYVGELDYDSDSIILQALVKAPNEKQTVFGIFAEPKLSKEIPLAFGFSYGKDGDDERKYQSKLEYEDDDTSKTKKSENNTGKYTAMAFDARIGYLVNDQLKISTVTKYESVKADDADKTCTALAVAGEVSYIVNDLATVFADVGYYNWNLGGEDTFAKVSCVKVRPGVVLNAGAGARVTAAFQYDSYSGDNKAKKNEMSIPVIFKVQL